MCKVICLFFIIGFLQFIQLDGQVIKEIDLNVSVRCSDGKIKKFVNIINENINTVVIVYDNGVTCHSCVEKSHKIAQKLHDKLKVVFLSNYKSLREIQILEKQLNLPNTFFYCKENRINDVIEDLQVPIAFCLINSNTNDNQKVELIDGRSIDLIIDNIYKIP